MSRRDTRWRISTGVALLLLAFALRMWNIGGPSLWLDEAMMLIMMPDGDELETVLGFEVLTHTNNGVLLPMYSALFDAIRQTVRDAVATAWNADFEGAWQRRIAALTQEINRHYEEVISHQPHAIGSGR